MSEVYAGENTTNSTRECTLIQVADTMKRNFQGVDDEVCHPHWSFHNTKEVR